MTWDIETFWSRCTYIPILPICTYVTAQNCKVKRNFISLLVYVLGKVQIYHCIIANAYFLTSLKVSYDRKKNVISPSVKITKNRLQDISSDSFYSSSFASSALELRSFCFCERVRVRLRRIPEWAKNRFLYSPPFTVRWTRKTGGQFLLQLKYILIDPLNISSKGGN